MKPLSDAEKKELERLNKRVKSDKATYRELVRAIGLTTRNKSH